MPEVARLRAILGWKNNGLFLIWSNDVHLTCVDTSVIIRVSVKENSETEKGFKLELHNNLNKSTLAYHYLIVDDCIADYG